MWRMPSWAKAPANLSAHRLRDRLAGVGGIKIMAAPVGVELAKQPVPVDTLGDAAKARERAFFRDQKGRIDRTRRIIERYHQVVLANLAGQPGKARSVLLQHHPRQRSSGPLAAMRRALWRRT